MHSIPANIIINSGIETSNRDPRSFKLYTSSSLGRDRSNDLIGTINYTTIKENLIEIGIYFDGENDGKLDEGDQIIFYGRGVSGINNHGIDIKQNRLTGTTSCTNLFNRLRAFRRAKSLDKWSVGFCVR